MFLPAPWCGVPLWCLTFVGIRSFQLGIVTVFACRRTGIDFFRLCMTESTTLTAITYASGSAAATARLTAGSFTFRALTFAACGLTFANGMELLIHIGVDTVDMNGDGFTLLVSEGQKVKAGTPLIRFDKEKIHAAGHPSVTVFIVTEEGNAKGIQYLSGMEAVAGETPVIRFQ